MGKDIRISSVRSYKASTSVRKFLVYYTNIRIRHKIYKNGNKNHEYACYDYYIKIMKEALHEKEKNFIGTFDSAKIFNFFDIQTFSNFNSLIINHIRIFAKIYDNV